MAWVAAGWFFSMVQIDFLSTSVTSSRESCVFSRVDQVSFCPVTSFLPGAGRRPVSWSKVRSARLLAACSVWCTWKERFDHRRRLSHHAVHDFRFRQHLIDHCPAGHVDLCPSRGSQRRWGGRGITASWIWRRRYGDLDMSEKDSACPLLYFGRRMFRSKSWT